jgi:Tol biopolymer transport system component
LGDIYEPAWAPDGKKIVFARRDSSKNRPLYLWEENGSEPIRLTKVEGVFAFPSFSPQIMQGGQ